MLRFADDLGKSARTERNAEPLAWANWNWPGVFPSRVMPAPSMASIGLGKLIVVTRLVATGTTTRTLSSSQSVKISLDGCAMTIAVERRNALTIDFIFEVHHGGGETAVQGHVGVAGEAQPQRERKRFGKRLFLEYAVADDLAGDRRQHLVFPGC